MKSKIISGKEQILWTAIVTPFTDDASEIDFEALKNVINLQAKAGNGIVVAGSTGEGLSLSDKERVKLMEFIFSLNLKIPVMFGVPSANYHQALDWMNYCSDFPLSGHLMTTPIYTKAGPKGQTEWFENLMNKSQAPCMLYNIPSRSGIRLHNDVIKNLKGHPHLWAIKDSSGAVDSIVEYKEVNPDINIFCGDDYLMPSFSAEGACGLVSVNANPWPVQTRKYVEMCLKNQKIPSKIWWRSTKALFTASNPIPVKALMFHLGIINSPVVRLPLSQNDLAQIEPILKAHQEILEWN